MSAVRLTTPPCSREEMLLQVASTYAGLAPLYRERTRPQIRERYLRHFKSLDTGSLVGDFGSGTGHDTNSLFEMGFEVKAIDLTREMHDIAVDSSPYRDKIDFQCADSLSVDVPLGGFDGLLSSMEVMHQYSLVDAIFRYSSLLRRNGILVMTTNHPIRNVLKRPELDHIGENFVCEKWSVSNNVPVFYRPLSTYLDAFRISGLEVESTEEYAATPDLAACHDFDLKNSGYPSIISFVCRKL